MILMIHNLSTEPHFNCSAVPLSQIAFSELVFQSVLCNFVEGLALFIFTFNAEELKSNSLYSFFIYCINFIRMNSLYLPSALISSSSAHIALHNGTFFAQKHFGSPPSAGPLHSPRLPVVFIHHVRRS